MIITRSKEFIEKRGLSVIYGDTDSLFVLVGNDVEEDAAERMGQELGDALNVWWRDVLYREFEIESWLEAEFDVLYLKFLMPTIRGSRRGSKKRYAGLVRTASGDLDVVFTGLETVRSDWTPLARSFQRELYRRIFMGEVYDDYVRTVARDLQSGKLDDQLVYRKRLRKRVGEYAHNVPPHVRAARLLDHPGAAVSYVITIRGPEPVEKVTAPLDYAHYLEKQLAPVADGILHFLDTSFSDLTDPQLRMFD